MSGFKPRTLKVPLYQEDWQQRVDLAKAAADAAERRWRDAEKRRGTEVRLMSEPPAAEAAYVEYERLAAEHDEIKAQAEAEGAVVVTVQALGRRKWSELVKANPPRTGDDVPDDVRENDKTLGVNDEGLGEALVPLAIADISDPDLSKDDLLNAISSAQWDLLYGAAFALNRSVGSDPKAAPRLRPSLSGDATES